MSHYISGGTNLLLSRSSFQHHLIGCPQILCWSSKGCIWKSWTLIIFWISRLFLEITLTDYKQLRLSSNINLQSKTSKKQGYCCPNCMCSIKTNFSQIIHQHFVRVSISRLKLMVRKLLVEYLPTNIPDLEDPFPIFLITKATKIPRGPTIDVSKISLWVCASDWFFVFQCLKHPWVYLKFCDYMFC